MRSGKLQDSRNISRDSRLAESARYSGRGSQEETPKHILSRCPRTRVSKLVFYAQSTGTVISGQPRTRVSKLVFYAQSTGTVISGQPRTRDSPPIIIIYIYDSLNALSAHTIRINLNMIFCTHVEHSPIKNNLHKVY